MDENEAVKLTVNLPIEDIRRLSQLARSSDCNRTTALVQAIRRLHLLFEAQERGAEIRIIPRYGKEKVLIL